MGAVRGEAALDDVGVGEEFAAPAVGATALVVDVDFGAGGGGGDGEGGLDGAEGDGARNFLVGDGDGLLMGCIAGGGDAEGVCAGGEEFVGGAVLEGQLYAVDGDAGGGRCHFQRQEILLLTLRRGAG